MIWRLLRSLCRNESKSEETFVVALMEIHLISCALFVFGTDKYGTEHNLVHLVLVEVPSVDSHCDLETVHS